MRRVNYRAIQSSAPVTPTFHGPPHITVGNEAAGDTLANCDYLDPGNGDELRNALQQAYSDGGGTVYARRGTYLIADSPLPVRNNVHLVGEGPGATVIAAATTAFGDLVELRGENMSVRDLSVMLVEGAEVEGTAAMYAIDGCINALIDNVSFNATLGTETSGKVYACIRIGATPTNRNIRVSRCSFYATTSDTFDYDNVSACIVTACTEGINANSPDSLFVSECYFRSNTGSPSNNCGVMVGGGVVSITGCAFDKHGHAAVMAAPRFGLIDGLVCNGNTAIFGNGKEGIYIFQPDDSSFPIEGITIHNNVVRAHPSGSLNEAIVVRNTSNTQDILYPSLVGNYCDTLGTGIGVYIDEGGAAQINRTLIDSNQLRENSNPISDTGTNTITGTNVT